MRLRRGTYSAIALVMMSVTSAAAEVRVTDHAGLMEALSAASGGDRIVLAPGRYGKLDLSAKLFPWAAYASAVTIASENASQRGVFDTVSLSGVTNLHFNQVTFDYVYAPGDKSHLNAVYVRGCSDIVIANSLFDGDEAKGTGTPADGYGTGRGLTVEQSRRIRIEGNTFKTWLRGGIFSTTSDLTVIGNDMSDLRSDGMDFASVQNVLIEKNHIHDFRLAGGTGDHPDMIQFWTARTTEPSVNVTIRSNLLDQGAGGRSQSIFIRNDRVDRGLAGEEMYYRNVRIENNLIRNGHIHGITVGETDTLAIVANTLIQSVSVKEGGKVTRPAINVNGPSRNVLIAKNVTPGLNTKGFNPTRNWSITANTIVQRDNPARADHYRNIFVNAEAAGRVTPADLRLLPGSAPALELLGSDYSRFEVKPQELDGYILHGPGSADPRRIKFDARNLYGPDGRVNAEDAMFAWDFGDGSTASGPAPQHDYARDGNFAVSVVAVLKDGQKVTLNKTVAISRD